MEHGSARTIACIAACRVYHAPYFLFLFENVCCGRCCVPLSSKTSSLLHVCAGVTTVLCTNAWRAHLAQARACAEMFPSSCWLRVRMVATPAEYLRITRTSNLRYVSAHATYCLVPLLCTCVYKVLEVAKIQRVSLCDHGREIDRILCGLVLIDDGTPAERFFVFRQRPSPPTFAAGSTTTIVLYSK